MKNVVIFLIILLCAIPVFSETGENEAFRLGFQADSDTYMGLIVKAGSLELGLKAQWNYIDINSGDENNGIVAGAHISYLFHGNNNMSSFGTGIDFRTGFGELPVAEYAEYVDAFLRLNYNYHISEKFMLSALFYPVSFTTREPEGGTYYMTIKIPSAALAAAVFF